MLSLNQRKRLTEDFEEKNSIDVTLKELKERFEEEKSNWKKMSWSIEVSFFFFKNFLFLLLLLSFQEDY